MTAPAADLIAARLDRLPATRYVWWLVTLLSLGGIFEFYDLFMTAPLGPGLVRANLFIRTSQAIFDIDALASFVAATFAGLFVGTIGFGFVADRLGRRAIFTYALLWYSAATAVMAFQTSAAGVDFWRFVAGVGVGVELVTIDSYIGELVPKHLRSKAFAFNQTVVFGAVPIVAFLAWLLVPRDPLGWAGWRWVTLIGATGALVVWVIRRGLPESPRWLAGQGRVAEAERVMAAIEARVAAESGGTLPSPQVAAHEAPGAVAFWEIFRPPYRKRTIMLVVFNVAQAVGFYGFQAWVPQFLTSQGITVTSSLLYTFIIALANPVGPLLGILFTQRIELKWQIVGAAFGLGAFGLAFSQMRSAEGVLVFGVLVVLCANVMSFAFHAYQAELYPTRIRARAVGFVYSWSRLSTIFNAFVINFFLHRTGTLGVFAFIAGAMVVVIVAIGGFGPRTRNRALETISG
jgi:putative MFS transporter